MSGMILLKKTLLLLTLIFCALTMSGCVYLRMLEVKKQFNQFDKYVEVDKENGLTLSFLDPILYDDDIKWLGFPPASRSTRSGSTTWKHVLEKKYKENQEETGNYDLVIETRYQNEKLNAVYFSERYFVALPKDFIPSLCEYMGKSSMDIDLISAKVKCTGELDDIQPFLPLVKQGSVVQIAGIPYSSVNKNGMTTLEYRYRLKRNSLSRLSRERENAEYIVRVTFSQQDALLNIEVKIPLIGSIEVDFNGLDFHVTAYNSID